MTLNLSEPKIFSQVTVTVRVHRPLWWQLRLRFGLWLMKMGIRITGMAVQFDADLPEPTLKERA